MQACFMTGEEERRFKKRRRRRRGGRERLRWFSGRGKKGESLSRNGAFAVARFEK